MRILAEGENFSQEQILEIASNEEQWKKLFDSYTSEITFDLTITAPEIDLVKVYIHNGKGSCIDHIYDFAISESLMGCSYTQGE